METGKSTRISKYAGTLDEAVDIQHALSVAMVQTPQYLQNNTTVGEWLDNWLTTYMQHTLKQSTYKSYETYVRKHFKPSLGTIKLKELTPGSCTGTVRGTDSLQSVWQCKPAAAHQTTY